MLERRNHRFSRENLSAYIDGRLREGQAARIGRHLARCAECRADLATVQETVLLLQQTPPLPVPRGFAVPITAQRERASFRRWNVAYGALRGATVAVALALFLFVSSDLLISTGVLGNLGTQTFEVTGHEPVLEVMQKAPTGAEQTIADTPQSELTAPPDKALVERPEAGAAFGASDQPVEQPKLQIESEKAVVAQQVEQAAEEQPVPESRPQVEDAPVAEGAAPPAQKLRLPKTAGSRAAATASPSASDTSSDAEPRSKGLGGGEPRPDPTERGEPSATVAPSATPSPTPTLMPSPTPARMAKLITPQRAAPLPDETQPGAAQPAVWHLWRGIRIGSGILLGLLLALSGALVLASRKRRV